jgi:hypothetical protein
VFKWGGQRVDAPAPATNAAAPDATIASKVFPRFMSALANRPAPVLVDLGPVVGSNVTYFGDRLGCKIFVENLFADVEAAARAGTRDALAATIGERLAHAPGTIDGVLCWDLFDYLPPAAGKALAGRLAALLAPGGVLHGLFGTTPIELKTYTRFIVEADDTLRLRPYAATPAARTVLVTRDINRMFDGLVVAESVLLKTNTRDTLFRR